ncbi:MAG: hypothetical protein EOO85_11090 [Pedobacter sp.]|nr:MAG: hypothetical protein EOO85_11090 [Pedobacter sp.]
MNTDLKYKVLFVKSEEISVNFFIDQLGFKMYQKIEINGKVCPLLQNANKDLMAFIENTGRDEINIMNTDDCLRDYYFFKQKNVEILGKPQYHHDGLTIDFNDPSGSRFVLLEERDYTDA